MAEINSVIPLNSVWNEVSVKMDEILTFKIYMLASAEMITCQEISDQTLRNVEFRS